jgi:hypothetical protein
MAKKAPVPFFHGIAREDGGTNVCPSRPWVLSQAIADRAAWFKQGIKVPSVAVNVSNVQLRQANFLSVFAGRKCDAVRAFPSMYDAPPVTVTISLQPQAALAEYTVHRHRTNDASR